MKFSFGAAFAAAALSVAVASPALARTAPVNGLFIQATTSTFIDIDLAGWASYGEFGADLNSTVFIDVAAGTEVIGFEYIGLSFATENGSWLRELTLSVNNSDASEFIDWRPSTVGASGSFGPESGAWAGATGAAGPFGAGAAFTAADGLLIVTVYESFDDPFGDGGATVDATISGGTLRILLAPIPEPSTYGMMALGLLAVGAAMRKRQQQA